MKLRANTMPPDASSKARVFELYAIVTVHTCDVEATVAAFTDFSKDLLF